MIYRNKMTGRFDRLYKNVIESYNSKNSLSYKLSRIYQLPHSMKIDVLSICDIHFDTDMNYRSEFGQIPINDNTNKFDEL